LFNNIFDDSQPTTAAACQLNFADEENFYDRFCQSDTLSPPGVTRGLPTVVPGAPQTTSREGLAMRIATVPAIAACAAALSASASPANADDHTFIQQIRE
jgi:hypothetical protein